MKDKCLSSSLFNALAVGLIVFLAIGCTDSSITVGSRVEVSSTGSDNSQPAAQDYADETVQFEINLVNHARLSIESINGDISIEGREDVTSIIVSAQKRVGSTSQSDARNHIQDLKIEITDDEDEILISSHHEERSDRASYEINYVVLLPVDLEINLLHLNGDVFLTNVQADVTIDLTNGFIDATLPVKDDREVQLAVVNGGIDVKIPSQTSASLSASVTNGLIEMMNLVLAVSDQAANAVEGLLGDGKGAIDLYVVNGTIVIEGIDSFDNHDCL